MSDALKDIQDQMDEAERLEREKRDLQAQKMILEKKRVGRDLQKLRETEDELERAKNTSFGVPDEKHIEHVRKENRDYIDAAKHSMLFINNAFYGIVPFFRKNLIFIGAKTGEGKSTIVANTAAHVIRQKNPLTGNLRKVLVITNEEKTEDVLNRVTCLMHGWHYVNHDQFTPEQVEKMDEMIGALSRGGRMMVIDNNYNGIPGMTTTLEGIQMIFDNLLRDGVYYDAILIDYYQNIKSSKNDPHLNEWEVQAKLANMLDNYKNIYPAPIVLLGQVEPTTKEDKPFQQRIKGRKVIMDPCTLVMEMIAERKELRTKWIVHKSRFTQAIGQEFYTGYHKGKYVLYDDSFKAYVNKIKEDRQWQDTIGKHIDKEKNGTDPKGSGSNEAEPAAGGDTPPKAEGG